MNRRFATKQEMLAGFDDQEGSPDMSREANKLDRTIRMAAAEHVWDLTDGNPDRSTPEGADKVAQAHTDITVSSARLIARSAAASHHRKEDLDELIRLVGDEIRRTVEMAHIWMTARALGIDLNGPVDDVPAEGASEPNPASPWAA